MKRFLSLLLTIFILLSGSTALAADPVPVSSVTLSETQVSVSVKKTVPLRTTVEPRDATVKVLEWTSSDENIATVRNGQVRGVNPGTATITATATDGSGVSASATVTVVAPLTRITPEYHTLSLIPDTTWALFWETEPANATNSEVNWKSSNERVATVNANGVISSHKAGTATITATAADGSGARASVNVTVKAHDIVILEPGDVDVDFETEETDVSIPVMKNGKPSTKKCLRQFKTKFGTVTSPENMVIHPAKAGSDTIYIIYNEKRKPIKTEYHTVYVAQTAVGEAPRLKENGEPAPIRFLDIPWGSNWPETKIHMEERGLGLKAISERNSYLRSMVDGQVIFGNLTAFSAALNYSYRRNDPMFEARNSFNNGDLYFDPSIPFAQIALTARCLYCLDEGKTVDGILTWQRGHVTVTLEQKERYTILQVTWDGTDEEAEAPEEDDDSGFEDE